MGKRDTQESIIKKFRENHGDFYNYDKVVYVDSTNQVIITCPIHGDFPQKPVLHNQGYGCRKCAGNYQMTQEEWVTEAKRVHDGFYSYEHTQYKTAHGDVFITCPTHGVFEQTAKEHLAGHKCYKCRFKVYDTLTFIGAAKEFHKETYDYSITEYVDATKDVYILCREHGLFQQAPYHHIYGAGCPTCKGRNYGKDRPAEIYVYRINNTHFGFGLTTNKSRHIGHNSAFKKAGAKGEKMPYRFTGRLEDVKFVESYLKKTLPISSAGVVGFKTEAILIKDFPEFLDVVQTSGLVLEYEIHDQQVELVSEASRCECNLDIG